MIFTTSRTYLDHFFAFGHEIEVSCWIFSFLSLMTKTDKFYIISHKNVTFKFVATNAKFYSVMIPNTSLSTASISNVNDFTLYDFGIHMSSVQCKGNSNWYIWIHWCNFWQKAAYQMRECTAFTMTFQLKRKTKYNKQLQKLTNYSG